MNMGKESMELFDVFAVMFGFLVFCIGAFILFDCILYPTNICIEHLMMAVVLCLAGPIIVNIKNETLQKRYLSAMTFFASVLACLFFIIIFIQNHILGNLIFTVVFLVYAFHRLLRFCKNEYG